MSEQNPPDSERRALPLAAAARRIGLSPDALRMRIYRGKAEGFKRDGRLFVYVEGDQNEQANNVRSVLSGTVASEAPLVELQASEIRRLMRENQRLAAEIERFLGLQEREQAMRGEIREAIGHMVSSGAAPSTPPASEIARLEARIGRSERRTERLAAPVEQLVRRMSHPGPDA